MNQIITQWQAAIGEALNLAERLTEFGEEDFAEAILEADKERDKDALLDALEDIVEEYDGEESELVCNIADAIALKISDEHNHNMVTYLNGAGEWLPRVPYGLEPYGLVETDYHTKEGYAFRAWSFPGSKSSDKLGTLFITYDFLRNEHNEPHIGFRLFFEESAVQESLEVLGGDGNTRPRMVNSEEKDIAIYKCIVSDMEEGTVEKTISLLMGAVYDDDTFQLLEEVALSAGILEVMPGAEDIPNLL
jgi:hypothetical protein